MFVFVTIVLWQFRRIKTDFNLKRTQGLIHVKRSKIEKHVHPNII